MSILYKVRTSLRSVDTMRAGQWLKINATSWSPQKQEEGNSRNMQCDAKRTAKKALEGIGGFASGKSKSNLELL